jgi:hypothetical protein
MAGDSDSEGRMINRTTESTDMEADLNSPRAVRDGIVKAEARAV